MAVNSKTDGNIFAKTPLIESLQFREYSPTKVYLKLENCHPCGSFKCRGMSRVCQSAVKKGSTEVIAASGGNAGLATALCSRLLGIKCRVIVPKTTSKLMINLIESEGAVVEVVGNVWNDAHNRAQQVAQESPNIHYVHPYDDPVLWSGHSTIIDEIAEQLDTTPSLIISSCGGGGLVCGIIEGMRRHNWNSVPVLAMGTPGAAALNTAIKAGLPVSPVALESITTVATSLGVSPICQQLADDYNRSEPPILSHLIEDRDAVDACLRFANQHRMLIEPACGVSLAALYTGLVNQLFKEEKVKRTDGPVVVIVCGGASVSLDILKEWKTRFNL